MKTIKHFFFALGAVALTLSACNHQALDQPDGSGQIMFNVGGPAFEASVLTKAAAVSDADLATNGFQVSCVTGNAGSDTQVWSNASFQKSGDVWKGDKWWPNSDPTYRFYAVYPASYAMTAAAGGATIAADNANDIICAYASAPAYKTNNVLNFNHIFARLGTVKVKELDGYTISDMTVSITPKTGGTFNLRTGAGKIDGTGWSDLTAGSATTIANSATNAFSSNVSTNANDIYLVPGTYELTASWTATKGDYTTTFSGKKVNVTLVGGKTNNIDANLTGNATELGFTVSVTAWGSNNVNVGSFPLD